MVEGSNESHGWLKNLPGLLRGFGAIAVLLSLYSFMMRGWDGSSDLIRYCMLLGHTGLLAVIALASGHYLKEGKGPRLLLRLAQVSVVVNFAILGAFIYSATTGVTVEAYPQYVAWSVDSLAVALFTSVAALIVLIPVMVIGFRALARGMSQQMTVLFIISNIALLLPLRDPKLAAVMTLVMGAYTLFITAKTSRQRTEVKTSEGMIALLLQFLPLIVLLGRNIWLYSADAILFSSACILFFVALRQYSLLVSGKSFLRKMAELFSVVLAVGSGFGIAGALLSVNVFESITVMLAGLLAAGMIYEISLRAGSSQGFYRVMASVVCTLTMLINLLLVGGLLASLITIFIGVAMIVVSYALQQRAIFIGGVLMTLIGLIDQALHMFQYFDFNYWIAMAITGVIAIVLGSLLESNGGRMKVWFGVCRQRYSAWSY
jgi:hypothetical protein